MPSKTFFTSDLHFGHARIIELCNRPFGSVAEMDEALILRWNDTVGADDLVWVLGDYALGDHHRGLAYLPSLNGTKVLVSGNHDRCWGGDRQAWKHVRDYLDAGFAAVHDYARTKLPPVSEGAAGQRVLLSHFPYVGDSGPEDRFTQYRLRDEGAWLLHGHVHTAYQVSGRGINVGVDVWDFTPVASDRLARLIADQSQAPSA